MDMFLRLSGSRYLERHHDPARHLALPDPSLTGFTEEHLAFAARAWTMRAEEEHRSASVFSELLAALVDCGAPLDLASGLSGLVADELRHAVLCTQLAARFRAPAPQARLAPVHARLAGSGGERSRLAFSLILVEGAIGETISSALFNAGRHLTREPCSRAALSAILRDEARHALFFWEAAATLGPTILDREREGLEEELRAALGAIELHQALPSLRRLEAALPFDQALARLGVLPPDRRVEAFYHALEQGVLPRLRRLGFDADRAWRDRHRQPAR